MGVSGHGEADGLVLALGVGGRGAVGVGRRGGFPWEGGVELRAVVLRADLGGARGGTGKVSGGSGEFGRGLGGGGLA